METSAVENAWAVQVPLSAARSLGVLRLTQGLHVRAEGDSLWLRGNNCPDALRRQLLKLPALNRYFIQPDNSLLPWGKVVPSGRLPEGEWSPLATWGQILLPTQGWPSAVEHTARLSLVRGGREQAAGAMLLSWDAWANFVTAAPRARLEGLLFVVNEQRQVIVRGEPLPSLPGARLGEQHGILVPFGWDWRPAVAPIIVRQVFGLDEGEMALWKSSDDWERIPADAWVKATRSAIRATRQEAADV